MTDPTSANRNLARNVRELRKTKNLSQQRLAELADMPRSTITNIESGSGNPSLNNLARLSGALGVGIEELLSRPRSSCSLTPASRVPVRSRQSGKVLIHKLLPEKVKGLEIDRMDLAPLSSMGGTPHVRGTKEYLYCLEGTLTVLISGEVYTPTRGDVLAFPGDQPHSYRNRSESPAAALSVVVPVPLIV